MADTNVQLVCIAGASASGKSASLRNLLPQDSVMYMNTESNKRLPFANKFDSYTIIDPLDVSNGFNAAEELPNIKTIVVDSLTFMMDQYESQYVLPATNTMQA